MNKLKNNQSGLTLIGLIGYIFLIVIVVMFIKNLRKAPEKVFEAKINNLFSIGDMFDSQSHKTTKINMDLSTNISGDDYLEDLERVVDGAKISLDLETDNETQEKYFAIDWSKTGNKYLDFSCNMDKNYQNIYMDLGNIFDKVIKIDMSKSINDEYFPKLIDESKAKKILKKEIDKQINEDYFKKEEVSKNGNKYTKNTFKMTSSELKQVIISMCSNLSTNNEFLACFSNSSTVKKTLTELISEMNEAKTTNKEYLEIAVYTKGFLNKTEIIEGIMAADGEEIKLLAQKNRKDEFDYTISEGSKVYVSGKVKLKLSKNSGNIDFSMGSDEVKFSTSIAYDITYNKPITKLNTSSAVSIDNLSDYDQKKLQKNLQDSNTKYVLYILFAPITYNTTVKQMDTVNMDRATEEVKRGW